MIIYDLESYPNIFTGTFVDDCTGAYWQFEISTRANHSSQLLQFLLWMKDSRTEGVGFNNLFYDYPMLHHFINSAGMMNHADMHWLSNDIIATGRNDNTKFKYAVWERDQYFPQIDLFKIHHFDNVARSTSLKKLEFVRRSENVEDLPFEVGTVLDHTQMDTLLKYNLHDVIETRGFFRDSKKQIEFRRSLNPSWMNYNDTKIGEHYFIEQLEKVSPGICYYKNQITGRKEKRQTHRSEIALRDVVLPIVRFQQPEFNRVLNWLNSQTIVETKGVFKDLSCTIDGFTYDFGTGGIHGSVSSQLVSSDDEYIIVDLDVTSYYPSLAIAHRLYPEHLSELFCDIYELLKTQRKSHAKGSTENAMLKLALNGVYGKSNSKYSPFYDPQYTIAITINGQLLLCMLSEWIMQQVPGVEHIQINTDGVTVRIPRAQKESLDNVARQWESYTGLELEEALYSRMWIRDVNNYIAEYENGKLKSKGAYEHKSLEWHKDHSALIVPMAAEMALVHGVDYEEFIRSHNDIYDFMCLAKVRRSDKLRWGGTDVQKTTRYYVSSSTDALPLVKWLPPLAKNPDKWRSISICAGYLTKVTNRMPERIDDINYDWYIDQARKLIEPFS